MKTYQQEMVEALERVSQRPSEAVEGLKKYYYGSRYMSFESSERVCLSAHVALRLGVISYQEHNRIIRDVARIGDGYGPFSFQKVS